MILDEKNRFLTKNAEKQSFVLFFFSGYFFHISYHFSIPNHPRYSKYLKNTFVLFFIHSCSYKPIYQKNPLLSHKINIVVKSKDRHENNLNLVKLNVSEQINVKNSKPSSLKLVIALKNPDGQKYTLG